MFGSISRWRGHVIAVAVVLLTGGLILTAAPSAYAASKPTVTFSSGPTVDGTSATLGYTMNRSGQAITSTTCSLNTAGTNTTASCGNRTTAAKTKPTQFSVTLEDLAAGTYTFTVTVALSDGGRATGTSSSFTIAAPVNCYDGARFTGDGSLSGPINTEHNWTQYLSLDGTCAVYAGNAPTIVSGADLEEARARCAEIIPVYFATPLPATNSYPTAPATWWFCA